MKNNVSHWVKKQIGETEFFSTLNLPWFDGSPRLFKSRIKTNACRRVPQGQNSFPYIFSSISSNVSLTFSNFWSTKCMRYSNGSQGSLAGCASHSRLQLPPNLEGSNTNTKQQSCCFCTGPLCFPGSVDPEQRNGRALLSAPSSSLGLFFWKVLLTSEWKQMFGWHLMWYKNKIKKKKCDTCETLHSITICQTGIPGLKTLKWADGLAWMRDPSVPGSEDHCCYL